MITLDALLIFLGAALLPVTYLFIVSQWIERACRQNAPETTASKTRPSAQADPVPKTA